ncbi:MAG: hypothetical protein HY247_04880 [archaeon]|nr:MAG: hypothetical protein HY247_04880 [archaeon]
MVTKGTKGLLVVMAATALVITPLVLLGVFVGLYVGEQTGYSGSVLAIGFSTAGFVAGVAIIFRVIRAVVGRTDGPVTPSS